MTITTKKLTHVIGGVKDWIRLRCTL